MVLNRSNRLAIMTMAALPLISLVGFRASASSNVVKLSVLMEQGTPPATTLAFLHKVVAGFEKLHPNIDVTISTYPSTATSTDIDTMIASHQGPNVFEIGTTFIPTLTASGAFVPWTSSMLKAVDVRDLVPAATKMDGIAGHLPIGIPDSASPFVLWYNKAMFKAAHIAKPPSTWNAFIQDAKILTNPKKGVWGAAIAPADPFYSMHLTWLLSRQNGGQVINAQGQKALFASPKVKQVVQFYLNWMKTFKIANTADAQYQEADMITAFMDGKAAMVPVGGLFDLPELKTAPSFLANDVGAAPNPVIPYGKSSTPAGGIPTESFVSGQEQVIFKYSSSPQQVAAAVQWIKYYTSAPEQVLMWKMYGDLPVNATAYKASALQTPLWKSFENIEEHASPTPKVAGWLDLPTVYDKNLSTVFDDVALHRYHKGELTSTLTTTDQQIDSTLQGLKAP